MARISLNLEGKYDNNKTLYYDICNGYISGMRSAGTSKNTIAQCYLEYDENFNIDNCYYYKYFDNYETFKSGNSLALYI